MHFNRIDLNEIFRITDIEGRGPFMQEILRQSIAGRDGSYRIERRIPERPLNVEGRILAKSKEDLREKVNYLNRILYTNEDRKSTRLNSSHVAISYAVFCLKKKKATRILCTS